MTEERIATYQGEFNKLFSEEPNARDEPTTKMADDLRHCAYLIDSIRKMFLVGLATGRITINHDAEDGE